MRDMRRAQSKNPRYVQRKKRAARTCSERMLRVVRMPFPMTCGEVATIMCTFIVFMMIAWSQEPTTIPCQPQASLQSHANNQVAIKKSPMPQSVAPFVVSKNEQFKKADGQQGEAGGQWSMCSHIEKYGPNFDRGMANFISGILRPESALEVGCGIGLYVNFMERFSTADGKDQGRFLGIEPEPMIRAKVFGQDPYQGIQLAMNVLEVEDQVLSDLGLFDVVLSSEVAEHIPCELHPKLFDVLVARTGKFLVFGAARVGQGGTGHICNGKQEEFLKEFIDRGLIHLPRVSERLRASCFNGWDKGANTFVLTTPKFVAKIGGVEFVEERYSGLNDVADLFPEFVRDVYTPIKVHKMKCE